MGVIYNPIREELYSACEGNGAHLNGSPIHTDTEGTVRFGVGMRKDFRERNKQTEISKQTYR